MANASNGPVEVQFALIPEMPPKKLLMEINFTSQDTVTTPTMAATSKLTTGTDILTSRMRMEPHISTTTQASGN